jgi:hypothetical protein
MPEIETIRSLAGGPEGLAAGVLPRVLRAAGRDVVLVDFLAIDLAPDIR